MEGLLFRVAGHEDYPAMLRVSEGVHNGCDFLPALFHRWVDQHNRTILLAELNGTAVGLISTYIVDGGDTALVQAWRVHPCCRGRGVGRVLRQYALSLARQQHPGLRRQRYSENAVIFDSKPSGDGVREVMRQTVLCFEGTSDTLMTHMPSLRLPPGGVSQLTPPQLHALFSDLAPLHSAIGGRVITSDCEGYCTSPSNIKLMDNGNRNVFASRTDKDLTVTISHSYGVEKGLRYNIDCFGRDLNSVKAHLITHMEGVSRAVDVIRFYIYVRADLLEGVRRFCADAGLRHVFCDRQQVLLEKDFEGETDSLPLRGSA
ncbi:histidine N-acetyltransferase-like [Branchiostoma lanceolatum]|uniref:histidine N-acetyltransferase-like n=1 Tax=Branchiostoma lanceolatum TaxID=7740 RepID=UPI00345300F1